MEKELSLEEKNLEVQVLRIDDLPILYAQLELLRFQSIIDDTIEVHGNWSGLSIGHLISLWICYLISESDHRLSAVEEWAAEHLSLLRVLSGQLEITQKDFTDDRLEKVLDYLSDESNWRIINKELTNSSLEVYDLDVHNTVRLDAAPMQGHKNVEASALFEYGYSKHHNPRLGMVKVMLACLDNAIHGFGYPLAHLTVSGSTADDVLYKPIIDECEQTLGRSQGSRKLYVGDSKMGSKENRHYIWQGDNDYLVPLSKLQLSNEERQTQISGYDVSAYKKVYKKDNNQEQGLVAQGFERWVTMHYQDQEGNEHSWQERHLYVLSTAYAVSQQRTLEDKLAHTYAVLEGLLESKQGKQRLKTREEVIKKTAGILEEKGLTGLLKVVIKEQQHTKKIRAYKDRPAREQTWSSFQLTISRDEEAISARKKQQGWQVYATTMSSEMIDFENIVWKYRYQNRVESRFNDLRNKVVPLVPIFLKKDNRVEALVNVLMVCLKVCSVIEFKIAKTLKAEQEELSTIYEGNPKRSTPNPTAKRVFRQFRGISIVILDKAEEIPEVLITDLKRVQLKIIRLLGFQSDIYVKLPEKFKLLFSQTKFNEI